METYHVLQIFVLMYTGFVLLFYAASFVRGLIGKDSLQKRARIVMRLNNLRGKRIVFILKIISTAYFVCWLALVIPWIDALIGFHFLTSFVDKDGYTGLKTWFGIFSDQGNQSAYYFITAVTATLGMCGFPIVWNLLEKLSDTRREIDANGAMHYRKEIELHDF